MSRPDATRQEAPTPGPPRAAVASSRQARRPRSASHAHQPRDGRARLLEVGPREDADRAHGGHCLSEDRLELVLAEDRPAGDEVQEELAVALGARDRRGAGAAHRVAEPLRLAGHVGAAPTGAARGRVTMPAAAHLGAADLELGLHQDHESAPGASTASSAGRTSRTEMNDTSIDRERAGLGHDVGGERARVHAVAHHDPRVARAAARAAGRGRRPPRSTRRAPRASSVSVKPPVEAPTSTATRPAGSTPRASSAPASLSAPRPTCAGPASTSTAAPSFTAGPGLRRPAGRRPARAPP